MKIYDYRQELIDLLKNTSAEPASLTQTLRSLTTIVHVLNHYTDAPAAPDQPHETRPRFHQQAPLPKRLLLKNGWLPTTAMLSTGS